MIPAINYSTSISRPAVIVSNHLTEVTPPAQLLQDSSLLGLCPISKGDTGTFQMISVPRCL